MGMYHKLKVGDLTINSIDWEMTPEFTFGTFESWGGRERVRNNSERIYYFYVDNWGERPKLCLMERGVKHARVMAEIQAPLEMMKDCVVSHGKVALFEQSFAINDKIQKWLIDNVLDVEMPVSSILLKKKRLWRIWARNFLNGTVIH